MRARRRRSSVRAQTLKFSHFVSILLVLTTINLACGDDDDAAAAAKAAAAACNPVGTFNVARAQYTASSDGGGQFCVDNAAIQNQAATAKTFVSTKNADGTFAFVVQGDNDAGFKAMTLDAAKCTLTMVEHSMVQVTDTMLGYGVSNETETTTITFTANATKLTLESVRDFSSAQNLSGTGNVSSVPCTLSSTTTGTKM
jgi:hypothetical protein